MVDVNNPKELEDAIDRGHLRRKRFGNKNLNNLRKRVLDTHLIIEEALEMIIEDRILELANTDTNLSDVKYTKKRGVEFLISMASMFERMGFHQKLNSSYVCLKVNKHLAYHITQVNKARNILVHPVGNKYKKYVKRDERLLLLRHILASLNGVTAIDIPYLNKLLTDSSG